MPDYRHAATRDLLLGSRYHDKILAMRRANLLAYWPLNEKFGTTGANSVLDWSGGNRGTPANVTFGSAGIMGETSAIFNGTTGRIDFSVNPFLTSFNGNSGSLIIWAKARDAAVWVDGLNGVPIRLFTDASNYIVIFKNGANFSCNRIATAPQGINVAHGSTLEYFSIGMAWSTTFLRVYFNGVENNFTFAPGVWGGILASTFVGAQSASANFWPGNICNVAVWNVPLNTGEMKALATIN